MDPAQIVENLSDLVSVLDQRRQDKRLVCTIGSWDILHQGHINYLKRAQELGDILVVGVDSDVAYLRHKGKSSMYPQEDRMNIVSALRYVDYLTIIDDVDRTGEWQMNLVKSLKPDLFVCNERSYSDDERTKIAKLCPIELVPFYEPRAASSSAYVAEHMKLIVLGEKTMKMSMRKVAFRLLTILLSLSIFTTLAMIFSVGFGIAKLPSGSLNLLIGKTTPELFGMMYIVIKYLFPVKEKVLT